MTIFLFMIRAILWQPRYLNSYYSNSLEAILTVIACIYPFILLQIDLIAPSQINDFLPLQLSLLELYWQR